MMIEHFGGTLEVSNLKELDDVLEARYGCGVNEYWMWGSKRFPTLAVQVRGDEACLHFFPSDGHPGFISIGDREDGSTVTFYTNTATEEIEVSAAAVVPFRVARSAVHEFVASRTMPSSVRWTEL